jgi:hypothetical protein
MFSQNLITIFANYQETSSVSLGFFVINMYNENIR